jgi:hypothetical protein
VVVRRRRATPGCGPAVLVDRGATSTERPLRHHRAATGEPAA